MRAYKFRIYPNATQRREMQLHLVKAKNLWNEMLETTKKTYSDFGLFSTTKALREYAKHGGLYCQVAWDVENRLKKSIQNMCAKRKKGLIAGFPRFKNIDRMKSLTYPQHPKHGFSFHGEKLKVTPFGLINIKLSREIQGKIKTLTLKREANKWYAIFIADTPKQVPRINTGTQVGIDLGLMTFATLSNGEKITKPKHYKLYEELLKKKQRQLSSKKRGSKNRRKAKLRLAVLHEKVRNIRRDWLHKLSTNLVNSYSLIALEKLAVQDISTEHGKGTSDAGWNMFANFLSYKAEEAGCQVEFVNPKNTSKECSRCGVLTKKTLWERTHNCPSCGLSMDRDINAAINILNRATPGYGGSNACEDGAIVPPMKQEAQRINEVD